MSGLMQSCVLKSLNNKTVLKHSQCLGIHFDRRKSQVVIKLSAGFAHETQAASCFPLCLFGSDDMT